MTNFIVHSIVKYIEDIPFLLMNRICISLSEADNSYFSRVQSTSESV